MREVRPRVGRPGQSWARSPSPASHVLQFPPSARLPFSPYPKLLQRAQGLWHHCPSLLLGEAGLAGPQPEQEGAFVE